MENNMDNTPAQAADAPATGGNTPTPVPTPTPATTPSVGAKSYDDQMARTQVTITCNNPRKKDSDRERFIFSNGVVGTQEYEVIFGEKLSLPKVIIDCIKDKTCMLKNVKKVNGIDVEVLQFGKEFTVA
jgi:hypothetical protein